jgi:hypothetical protein
MMKACSGIENISLDSIVLLTIYPHEFMWHADQAFEL